jgi:hypothetical protein
LENQWAYPRALPGVFGHPHYGGNGEALASIEFTLQHTDDKSVGAYRKFSSDNASNPILGNAVMIDASKAGVPGNGQPFPDGAKMAKIHWNPTTNETAPGQPTVPGTLHDVDFMVKDRRRFADSDGWGWAVFTHDAASGTFMPGTMADHPPQGNDAKCGFTCHTKVKHRDYVFTEYGKR